MRTCSGATMAAAVQAGSGRLALALGEMGPGGLNLAAGAGVAFNNHLPALFVTSNQHRAASYPHRGMNCNHDHHTLAFADADNDALNHVAFVMPTLDAVMRGGGRMKDAGHPIEWGPGRHGPGDNAFNYFIDPFGLVIEYTAEVQQIDDGYVVRGPADWAWPTGRVDHWGISAPPSARLKQAQRAVLFAPSL